ncbi:hypothetical protein [Rouxiella sp. WC2420]|uniref:Uncharacterized protein n=1 Tax=Rouxiella sp. WC2420 TaxID=3234145 RepID=A0AB39VME9_9GAMM
MFTMQTARWSLSVVINNIFCWHTASETVGDREYTLNSNPSEDISIYLARWGVEMSDKEQTILTRELSK